MNELKREDLTIPINIAKAHAFALERHRGQKRRGTKEAYIHQPERVVYILSLYDEDIDLLAAAMLHDLVENTHTNAHDIYTVFGDRIGGLVEELTIDPYAKKILGKKKYLVECMNKMSNDAFTIKLADRLDNVMGLIDSSVSIDFVAWYWKETNYIIDNLNRNSYSKTQECLLNTIGFNLKYLEVLKEL